MPFKSRRSGKSGNARLRPNSSVDRAWTIERKRTVDPHPLQEGTSRSIWLINATPHSPQMLQRNVRLPGATGAGAAARRNRFSENRELMAIVIALVCAEACQS
jgi:hypothetical protein